MSRYGQVPRNLVHRNKRPLALARGHNPLTAGPEPSSHSICLVSVQTLSPEKASPGHILGPLHRSPPLTLLVFLTTFLTPRSEYLPAACLAPGDAGQSPAVWLITSWGAQQVPAGGVAEQVAPPFVRVTQQRTWLGRTFGSAGCWTSALHQACWVRSHRTDSSGRCVFFFFFFYFFFYLSLSFPHRPPSFLLKP